MTTTAVFLGDRTLAVVAGRPAARGGVELTHAASAALPEDFGTRDAHGQAEAVREALDAAGGGARKCVLVIPRPLAILRTFSVPPGTPEELQNMIRFQLEKELPFPLDQVRYACSTMEEGDRIRVTAAAVPIEALDRRIAPLEAAGLRVTGAVVSSFGLMRLLPPGPEEGGSLLLNLADGAAEILIADAGRIELSRNSPQKDQDSETLAAEIDRAILSHSAKGGGLDVRRVFVAGEGEPAERIAVELGKSLHGPSVAALVLNGTVTRPPDLRITAELAATAGVLVGVLDPRPAVPDLLRPPVVRRALKVTRLHKIAAAAGAAVLALFLASQVALSGRRSELERVRKELAAVKPKADAVDRMRSEIRTLQLWQDRRFSWIDLFDQIQRRLAANRIHLATLRADENGGLSLSGKAKDRASGLDFVSQLQKMGKVFAEIGSPNFKPNSEKGEYTELFELKITLADLAPPKKQGGKPPAKK